MLPTFEAIGVNLPAVLVAAILNMILGSLWYSPVLFGNIWLKSLGKSKKDFEKMKKGGRAYAVSAVMSLITAYVLALFINFSLAVSAIDGMLIGFLVWIGFVITTNISNVLYEGRPAKVYLIYMKYQLASLLIMGAILAAW